MTEKEAHPLSGRNRLWGAQQQGLCLLLPHPQGLSTPPPTTTTCTLSDTKSKFLGRCEGLTLPCLRHRSRKEPEEIVLRELSPDPQHSPLQTPSLMTESLRSPQPQPWPHERLQPQGGVLTKEAPLLDHRHRYPHQFPLCVLVPHTFPGTVPLSVCLSVMSSGKNNMAIGHLSNKTKKKQTKVPGDTQGQGLLLLQEG